VSNLNFQCKKSCTQLPELRLAKGLTQMELAFNCGDFDYSQINRIELGKVNFSVSYLVLLAKELDVTPNELLMFDE
jgi:transcriptional regulator with XRE-family HTH domain